MFTLLRTSALGTGQMKTRQKPMATYMCWIWKKDPTLTMCCESSLSTMITWAGWFSCWPWATNLCSPSQEDNDEGRHLYHYHFKAWPDHGVPHDPGAVLGFLQDINLRQEELKKNDPGPVIVHCSAGIGRTGTFIVVDIILNVMSASGEWLYYNYVLTTMCAWPLIPKFTLVGTCYM